MYRTAAMKVSSKHGSCHWPVIRQSSSYIAYGSRSSRPLGELMLNWRRSAATAGPMLGMSSRREIFCLLVDCRVVGVVRFICVSSFTELHYQIEQTSNSLGILPAHRQPHQRSEERLMVFNESLAARTCDSSATAHARSSPIKLIKQSVSKGLRLEGKLLFPKVN